MKEKQYIINEARLIELLSDYYRLACLEWNGVDNWGGYMSNKAEYLDKFDSFEDKAKNDLKFYEKFIDGRNVLKRINLSFKQDCYNFYKTMTGEIYTCSDGTIFYERDEAIKYETELIIKEENNA